MQALDCGLTRPRDHILLEDLCQFLPEDKAKAAFPVLDVDGDGSVSMADMRDAVVGIYKERKNLALTLKVPFRVLRVQQLACGPAMHPGPRLDCCQVACRCSVGRPSVLRRVL